MPKKTKAKTKKKTVKAIAKRFRITKSGKIKKIKSGQNHFNTRESGKVKRNKRQDKTVTNKKQQLLIKKLS